MHNKELRASGKATLHYWDPVGQGSKDGWWGHVSLTLDDGTYISYWPSTPVDGLFDSVPARPANYQLDVIGEGGRLPQNIEILGVDTAAIRTWWNNGNHGNFTSLNNCSTIVTGALRAGGLKQGD